jgi:hypothetical protein
MQSNRSVKGNKKALWKQCQSITIGKKQIDRKRNCFFAAVIHMSGKKKPCLHDYYRTDPVMQTVYAKLIGTSCG